MAVSAEFTVTVQLAAAPNDPHAPPQLTNVLPLAAAAVSVTIVPALTFTEADVHDPAAQVMPPLMPPSPAPVLTTVSGN